MIKFKNLIYLFGIIGLLISSSASARITHVLDYNYEHFLIREDDPNKISKCSSGYYETQEIPRHMTCSDKTKVGILTCWLKSSCSCSGIYKNVDGVCKKK